MEAHSFTCQTDSMLHDNTSVHTSRKYPGQTYSLATVIASFLGNISSIAPDSSNRGYDAQTFAAQDRKSTVGNSSCAEK